MLLPAAIYLAIAPPALAAGWAIPTTTDTAFAVALIALLGTRVPVELRIFLTAAAIVDDLVAIAIVALFYSEDLNLAYGVAAAAACALLGVLNRGGVYRALPYALLGVLLWACLHGAGLHATLAGVVLAIATPTRPPPNLRALMGQAQTIFDHELRHAGERVMRHGPSEPNLRALDGLVLGKPAGMLLFAAAAVRLKLAVKPAAYSWRQMLGAGALAGIGFTMSLYIASKAFAGEAHFSAAKLAVFLASVVAGIIGTALLARSRS